MYTFFRQAWKKDEIEIRSAGMSATFKDVNGVSSCMINVIRGAHTKIVCMFSNENIF